jgi:hypothetical protein
MKHWHQDFLLELVHTSPFVLEFRLKGVCGGPDGGFSTNKGGYWLRLNLHTGVLIISFSVANARACTSTLCQLTGKS